MRTRLNRAERRHRRAKPVVTVSLEEGEIIRYPEEKAITEQELAELDQQALAGEILLVICEYVEMDFTPEGTEHADRT